MLIDSFVFHGYHFFSTLYYDKKQVSKVDETRFFLDHTVIILVIDLYF